MGLRNTVVGVGVLCALGVAVSLTLNSAPEAALQSATPAPQKAEGEPLARLGNLALPADELKALLATLPAAERARLKEDRSTLQAWIRSRLAEKALLEQAHNQGWDGRPEIQRMTREASEQILLRTYLESVSKVPDSYPSEAELQAAYDAGKDNWVTPPMLRVSQIFIAVGSQRSDEQARKQIQELGRQARVAKADFAALARAHSEDAVTAQRGGDSGLQPLQHFVPGMREVLQALKPGEVSEPLRSDAGYHLLKLAERQPARTASLAEVRERLRDSLRAQRQQQVARAYLEGLLDSTTLSIDGARIGQALESEG